MKKYFGVITVLMVGLNSLTVQAAVENGWEEIDGKYYWYENSVLQGYLPENTNYRGKEIYDAASDAWYWLDNAQGGAKAVNKDVYQESDAGQWAEKEDGTGKWVRYDANGHMVKGWNVNENGTYYFDLVYGTMAKGSVLIDRQECYFDEHTGIGADCTWVVLDDISYWYEGGVRQGYLPEDAGFRGKEIYDAASDAWYWLDNVQGGAKAVNKDVYQESDAGQWAEKEDGTGKWVRYDANGHMVKGWDTNENGTYYFDPVYGTMAKGSVEIDGVTYQFDEVTGILYQDGNQSSDNLSLSWYLTRDAKYNANHNLISQSVYEYDNAGHCTRFMQYEGIANRITYHEMSEYDTEGSLVKQIIQNYSTSGFYYMSEETVCEYEKGALCSQSKTVFDYMGKISYIEVTTYRLNEKIENIYRYDTEGALTYQSMYEYDEKGNLLQIQCENIANLKASVTVSYENDSQGRVLKMKEYDYQGELLYTTEYTYDNQSGELACYETRDERNGYATEKREFDYNQKGDCVENRYYYRMAIPADESKNDYVYEMKLRSKNIYSYDEGGNLTQADSYSYDSTGDERHISCMVYTYENDEKQGALVKTYDSYYEHSAIDENGYFVYDENGKIIYELGYHYGYENNRNQEGELSKQTFYSGNAKNHYTKELNYWVEYPVITLSEPEDLGQSCAKSPYSITYNADGSVKSYTVQEYTAYGE